MGNTSSAISGAATLDSYIGELSDISFEKSLSSSRFLKCVRGKHEDGQVVVKLFVKAGTMNLKKALRQMELEKDQLLSIPNSLSYQRLQETDRAVYLVRQYIASNLYDRVSTRPFLEAIEKRWIVFQLLTGLRDCHARGIHHGDIKTENVLVTSWNWIYLTDFAFFKPTYLPENNPADFSYYFDTSFRRTCYLAPERFHGVNETKTGSVTEAMDIFSLGCVIAELFLEGSALFDLSQLFKYKAGEYDPSGLLERIDDLEIRSLILHMINLDPDKRYSAEGYLNKWQRRAFPNYFTTFLHQYVALISEPQRHHVQVPCPDIDDQLDRVFFEFDQISFFLKFDDLDGKFTNDELRNQGTASTLSIPNYQKLQPSASKRIGNEDGALIFLSILLAGVRNTTRTISRVRTCDTILALSERISDEAKLDRVVPFLASLMADEAPEVRMSALSSLTQVLAMVRMLTPVNAFVFPEYILPRLTPFVADHSVMVRIKYAQCILTIAKTAKRFVDMAYALRDEGFLTLVDMAETGSDQLEDARLPTLFEFGKKDQDRLICEHVVTLLTDPHSVVKRALLPSIGELSVSFGVHRANDLILSHLITYLNDKDWLLKAAFFRHIVALGRYIGRVSVEQYIVPLLIQTLTDTEDLIVEKVLSVLAELVQFHLIEKAMATSLLAVVVRFLIHPNLWIQEASTGFIRAVCDDLAPADLYCVVYPKIRPFLRTEVYALTPVAILQSLRRPLPWPILDLAIKWAATAKLEHNSFWTSSNHLKEFSGDIAYINASPAALNAANSVGNQRPIKHGDRFLHVKDSEDETHLSKLRNAGFKPEEEWKLLALKEYIWRIANLQKELVKAPQDSLRQPPQLTMPTTIFFDHLGQETVRSEQTTSDKHVLSHDVKAALRDASLNLDINKSKRTARRVVTNSSTPILVGKSHSASASTQKGSTLTNMESTEVDNAQNHALQRVLTDESVESSRASGINGEARMSIPRLSSAVNLPGISSKAVAEVSMTNTTAVGQLDHHCANVETLLSAKNPEPQRHTRVSHTYNGVDSTILHMLDKLYASNHPEAFDGFGANVAPSPPQSGSKSDATWKPESVLVAHIQEHTAAINRVLVSPDHVFFVTCSDDGTIKIWDSGKLERNVVNRARMTYRGMSGSRVKSICFLENSYCVAAASDRGVIHVIKIDCTVNTSGIAKYGTIQLIRQFELGTDESTISMQHALQNQASILFVATTRSRILAIDLRTMDVLYALQNPASHGMLTCFCTDKRKTWLLVGTARGVLDLWDLRFRLRVKSIGLPHAARVYSLCIHPARGRGRWVCVASAETPEISVWDIEKSTCREKYRPMGCPTEAATTTTTDQLAWDIEDSRPEELLAKFTNEIALASGHERTRPAVGTRSLIVAGEMNGVQNSRTSGLCLLTASTDQVIRRWDVNKVEQSAIVCGLDMSDGKTTYRSSTSGATVLNEELEAKPTSRSAKKVGKSSIVSAAAQNQLLRGHMDTVLDLAYLQWPYQMILSVDRSGVLKVFA